MEYIVALLEKNPASLVSGRYLLLKNLWCIGGFVHIQAQTHALPPSRDAGMHVADDLTMLAIWVCYLEEE